MLWNQLLRYLAYFTLVIVVLGLNRANADYLVVSDFGKETAAFSGTNRGFRFRSDSNQMVIGLSVYDMTGNGLSVKTGYLGMDVSLWSDSGVLLAGEVVPSGVQAPIINGFRTVMLSSPIELKEGNFYRVVADMGDSNLIDKFWFDSPLVQTNQISMVQSIFGASSPGNGSYFFPSSLGTLNRASIGPNVYISSVPEPSSVLLCVAAMVITLARSRLQVLIRKN